MPIDLKLLGRKPLGKLCSEALAALLERDAACFRELGRGGIEPAQRRLLEREYRQLGESAAVEVADWLAAAKPE